jgi:NAD(P)-dependent dehydrogenase (short-subunit alcohol dehydrogenase family)
MEISNSVAFVTGGNRGLGLAFVQELQARGGRTVYAGVRDLDTVQLDGVVPVKVDVTDPSSVQAAAKRCGDITLLINNAGVGAVSAGALDPDFVDSARQMFNTNFYGIVRTSQAFAPAISHNGGGAIVNVLSDVTWYAREWNAAYATTKSAAWSYSNSLRLTLRDRAVQVLSLHVGFMNTDMVRGFDAPKTEPRVIARITLDALETDQDEVMADEQTRLAHRGLLTEPAYYLDPPPLAPLNEGAVSPERSRR